MANRILNVWYLLDNDTTLADDYLELFQPFTRLTHLDFVENFYCDRQKMVEFFGLIVPNNPGLKYLSWDIRVGNHTVWDDKQIKTASTAETLAREPSIRELCIEFRAQAGRAWGLDEGTLQFVKSFNPFFYGVRKLRLKGMSQLFTNWHDSLLRLPPLNASAYLLDLPNLEDFTYHCDEFRTSMMMFANVNVRHLALIRRLTTGVNIFGSSPEFWEVSAVYLKPSK